MITVEGLSEDIFIAETQNNYYLVYALNKKEYLITRINDKISDIKLIYSLFNNENLWISTIKHSKKINFFEIEPLISHLK